MKALTLTQPWASLVAIGAKRYETRSWGTSYRGPLAIHAAAAFPGWAREFGEEMAERYGRLDRPGALPRGAVVATCRLVNVVRTSQQVAPDEHEDRLGDCGWAFLEDGPTWKTWKRSRARHTKMDRKANSGIVGESAWRRTVKSGVGKDSP